MTTPAMRSAPVREERAHAQSGGERQHDRDEDGLGDGDRRHDEGLVEVGAEQSDAQRREDDRQQRERRHQRDRVLGVAAGLDVALGKKRRQRRDRERDQHDLDVDGKVEAADERQRDQRHGQIHRDQRSDQQPRLSPQVEQVAGPCPEAEAEHCCQDAHLQGEHDDLLAVHGPSPRQVRLAVGPHPFSSSSAVRSGTGSADLAARRTQRNPTWQVEVSMGCGMRAAGR
jgi:hypothetical protein